MKKNKVITKFNINMKKRIVKLTTLLAVLLYAMVTAQAAAPSISITVNPVPAVTFTASSGATFTQCPESSSSTAVATFNLPALTGPTNLSFGDQVQYSWTKDFAAPFDGTAATVTQGTVALKVFARPFNSAGTATCNGKVKIDSFFLAVNPFVPVTITGPSTYCATSGAGFTIGASPTDVVSATWTVTSGVITNGNTFSPTIDFTGLATGPQTVTVNYTANTNCTFTASVTVHIDALPVVTPSTYSTVLANNTVCYEGSVDLTKFVEATLDGSAITITSSNTEFATDAAFTQIIPAASVTVYQSTAGTTTTIWARVKSAANCTTLDANAASFTVTRYTELNIDQFTLTAGTLTIDNSEVCSNTTDNSANTYTLTIKASGGCPTLDHYEVVLSSVPAGITFSGAGVSGNTVTLTPAEAAAGKSITVTIPADATSRNITVVSISSKGAASGSCIDCSRTTWP